MYEVPPITEVPLETRMTVLTTTWNKFRNIWSNGSFAGLCVQALALVPLQENFAFPRTSLQGAEQSPLHSPSASLKTHSPGMSS